jgi:NAD(P)-dependent dehydrogenase (short-subunit alcohol dehydrogenase family)
MEVDIVGRVAIVTGPAEGIGGAIARLLRSSGATVETIMESDGDTVAAAIARHGHLDILINLAVEGGEGAAAAVEGLSRAAADAMGQAGGRIVTVASALGIIPARGETALSIAAAAIFALTRSLALEFGPRKILVNAVAAGPTEHGGALAERLLSHVPLPRAATFDEIASAALFLVDPDNSYTTGHVMVVDGGWTAGYARNF